MEEETWAPNRGREGRRARKRRNSQDAFAFLSVVLSCEINCFGSFPCLWSGLLDKTWLLRLNLNSGFLFLQIWAEHFCSVSGESEFTFVFLNDTFSILSLISLQTQQSWRRLVCVSVLDLLVFRQTDRWTDGRTDGPTAVMDGVLSASHQCFNKESNCFTTVVVPSQRLSASTTDPNRPAPEVVKQLWVCQVLLILIISDYWSFSSMLTQFSLEEI